MFLLLFFPIFLDLSGFSVVLLTRNEPNSPVHVGFIILLLFALHRVAKWFYHMKFDRLSILALYLFSLSCTFAFLFSEVPPIFVIQFFCLYLFIPLCIFSIHQYFGFLLKLSILLDTLGLFILLSAMIIIGGTRGIYIYQLLVTFPAVLVLYAYTLLPMLDYYNKKKILSMRLMISANILAVFIILSLTARKIGFLDLLVFLFVAQSLAVKHIYINKFGSIVLTKSLAYVVLCIYPIAIVGVIFSLISSRLFTRFLDDLASGEADGSRLSNWTEGFLIITSDLKSFLIGADFFALSDTNFHNFFLDASVRFGVPMTALLLLFLVRVLFYFHHQVRHNQVARYAFYGVVTNMLLHSTINSALSQSMYISALTCSLAGIMFIARTTKVDTI